MSVALGCDISHNNGAVDFVALKKSGFSYVWIKASQGNNFVDPMFQHNWNEASNAGLIRGAYHFTQSGSGGDSQAIHFHNTLHNAGGLKDTDMGVCLDYEDRTGIAHIGTKAAVAEAYECLQTMQTLTTRRPVIYLDYSMGAEESNGAFGEYHLWLADYTNNPTPSIPKQWTEEIFWQWNQYGTAGGVSGMDLDRCVLDLPGLQQWCKGTIIG